jgi:hypothetical protein
VALVAFAASVTSLGNRYAYDDVLIVEENPAVTELRAPTAYFGESYWGPTREVEALYRPLTILLYSVQWAIGDGSPFPFHAVNVALNTAAAVLAFAFLWQLLPPLAAVLAAMLFAAHPVHVEAVANVVGQAELWVAAAVFGAVTLYARRRRRGPLDVRTGALVAACYFVSLFVKEHGIVLPGLVLCLELAGRATVFTRQDHDIRRMRLLVLVLLLLATIFVAIRVGVIGAVTGDEPFWGLRGLSAPARASVMLALVPEFLRLLVWPVRLYADYAPQQVPVLPQLGVAHIPGALMLIGVLAAFVVAGRRMRAPLVAFALAWCGITLILVSSLLFPIGVLIAERTLFLPSFAAALLVGVALARWAEVPGPRRTALLTVAGTCVLLGTIHSAQRQPVWEDNLTVFSTLVVESPENFRGHFALGELYMAGGDAVRSDSSFRRALELYPDHVPARIKYAQLLQVQYRCEEALPLLRSAMADDPRSEAAVIGTAICLLDQQRVEEARRLALFGITSGWPGKALRDLRQIAESVLVATDSVDARNRWWRAGRPFDRNGGRLRLTVGVIGSGGVRPIRERPTLQDPTPSATMPNP